MGILTFVSQAEEQYEDFLYISFEMHLKWKLPETGGRREWMQYSGYMSKLLATMQILLIKPSC